MTDYCDDCAVTGLDECECVTPRRSSWKRAALLLLAPLACALFVAACSTDIDVHVDCPRTCVTTGELTAPAAPPELQAPR